MKSKIFVVAGVGLALTSCSPFPRELRNEVKLANDRLVQAEKDYGRAQSEVLADLKSAPDLFNGTAVASLWPAGLRAAKSKLDAANRDRSELETLERSSGRDAVPSAERLVSEEDRLRKEALDEANTIQAQALYWLDFRKNASHYAVKMDDEHEAAHEADLAKVKTTVEKAESDWPAKKADLEARLATLASEPARADAAWRSTAEARAAAENGNATGPQIATLIGANHTLSDAARLPEQAKDLEARCGQLYVSWDKILEDLDREHGDYREKIKIVKTRGADVATDERWEDVTPAAYQSVENDLGMAIAHKDMGLYDSEASNIAQPAGFAYIASPSAGSNQYGYWTHSGGSSVWTWLPQYLIMRELFWGPSYRPVVINEYNGYYQAQRLGRTYYGETTPAAPPKYGTHGTFTQQRYANSRYVQSGGFRNSGFGSRQTAAPAESSPQPHFGDAPSDSRVGKRFGNGSGGPPAGRRFGSPGGGARPSGKGFGGHRR